MKLKIAFCGLVAAAVAGTGCCSTHHHHFTTKISKKEAGKIAKCQVPGATVRDTNLEKVDGRLLWDVHLAQSGTSNITEVHLDANTGEVVRKD